MFIDKVNVKLKAGDGGKGIVSWRHEKFIAYGGPNGGDGGKGGDVVLVGSNSEQTLATFRYQPRLEAKTGQDGGDSNKRGRSGLDLVVRVPVGTVVTNKKGEILADITAAEQSVVIAKGGKGGFGNAHFKSSTRQAPRVSEKGEPGEEFEANLELKMIADIGLVGLPNAGKSTFLSIVSNARPEIADYPFTTLRPNLGVADIYGKTLLMADIPGLIAGASEGKGLGDEFLRHIERTKVLIHLIDCRSEDIVADYKVILNELKNYKVDLTKKPSIVAISKTDTVPPEEAVKKTKLIQKAVPKGTLVFAISAVSKANTTELLAAAGALATKKTAKKKVLKPENDLPVYELKETDDDFTVTKMDDYFLVVGGKIERFAKRTNFGDEYGEERFLDIMRKLFITRELSRIGAKSGSIVVFGDPEVGRIEL